MTHFVARGVAATACGIDPMKVRICDDWSRVTCPRCHDNRHCDGEFCGEAGCTASVSGSARPAEPKVGDPVKVEWTDACTSYGWHALEEHDPKPSDAVTVGILVKTEPGFVSVAHCGSSTGNYSEVLTIPRQMVKRLVALRE